jgi:peptidyl-prolyl cis-trans isomerase C
MRTRLWAAGLGLAVLTGLATAQAQPPGQPKQTGKPAAVVNGVAITTAEIEAVLKASGPAPVQLAESQRRQRQMEALAMLIDNLLMRQLLQKHTAPVSAEEVNRRLKEMEAGLREQGKTLQEFCHDTNQTDAQLRAGIADHLRWAAYAKAHISDAAVQAYYADNKDFFDGVTVRASHIVIRVPAGTAEAERNKARAKLEELRKQLLADPKADFAALAKLYSQDPRAAQGGDLGYFPRKWVFDEPFARAAFALQVGQISDVVQTDYGYHLIKVTDRKPGKPSNFTELKEAVREFCTEDLRQGLLAKERKAAKIEVNLP